MLFISPLIAMPQQHGGCVYPDAVLRAMHAAGVVFDYVWLAWPLRKRKVIMRDPLRAPFVRSGFIPGTYLLGNLRVREPRDWWRPAPCLSGSAISVESLPGSDEQSFLRRLLRRVDARAILVDFATTLPVLDGLSEFERAQLRVAVLTHNLIHRRTELYRDRGLPLDFRGLTRDEEAALLRRADVIVAIQDREAEEFRAMLPDREVVVVPLPVEFAPQPPGAIIGARCLFVGGYSGHNLDGLRWFLSEVWPAVLVAIPQAQFEVAGTASEVVPAGTPGVRPLGSVDTLAPVYARAAVCVVPLRFGTGLKIKLLEAMAHGRAVVTTAAGAEGFSELEEGGVVVVAEDAPSMAKAIVDLLSSPAARASQVARQHEWLCNHCAAGRAIKPLLDFGRERLWTAAESTASSSS